MGEVKGMTELKPCPFCGGEAMLQSHRVQGDDRFTETWIFCVDCLGQTRQYLSAKRAIEAWNRRDAQPEIIRCKDCKHRYEDECPMHHVELVDV